MWVRLANAGIGIHKFLVFKKKNCDGLQIYAFWLFFFTGTYNKTASWRNFRMKVNGQYPYLFWFLCECQKCHINGHIFWLCWLLSFFWKLQRTARLSIWYKIQLDKFVLAGKHTAIKFCPGSAFYLEVRNCKNEWEFEILHKKKYILTIDWTKKAIEIYAEKELTYEITDKKLTTDWKK